ncbi:hypothetical protein F5B19DRAFT_5269 [Rostrohypoxylon terebratum]|nr:hypothetical protein F5B19DRAFT_5269 [Rostrohypoxylon terebratum]
MSGSSSTGPGLPVNGIQAHHENSTPQRPTLPDHSHPPMQQANSYSAMYDRVANARIQTGSRHYEFYTDDDIKNNSPKGWPSIAAVQTYFPNHSSQRAFGVSVQQFLTNYQQKIHCIDNRLDEMNFEDSEASGNPLRSLPFKQESFLDRSIRGVGHLPIPPDPHSGELDRESQRENLIMTKAKYLTTYFTILIMNSEIKKFTRTSRRAHESHFKAQVDEGLDNEALAYMRYIDDFISDAPDQIFQKFESLLYTESPWMMKLLGHLSRLFGGSNPSHVDPDDPRVTLSLWPFRIFIKILLVLSSQSLLVIPVALLYLQLDWSRGIYLVIVTAFAIIFTIAMAWFEPRFAYLFVGVTAYYAVLVAFLANLPGCTSA